MTVPAFRGLRIALLIQTAIGLTVAGMIWVPHALAAFALAGCAILWRWSR